jgi:hypothetical protein
MSKPRYQTIHINQTKRWPVGDRDTAKLWFLLQYAGEDGGLRDLGGLPIRYQELAVMLEISDKAASSFLTRMKEAGVLYKLGGRKGTYYINPDYIRFDREFQS